MYKKTVGRFIFEGLRYFLYLDYTFCCYLYLLLLMVPLLISMFTYNISGHLHNGLLIVRKQAHAMNKAMVLLKTYWQTTDHVSTPDDALYCQSNEIDFPAQMFKGI
jgi:hypothetical protein